MCVYPLDGQGVYVGYPSKEKYRVWIPDVSATDISKAESRAADYEGLGKILLQVHGCTLQHYLQVHVECSCACTVLYRTVGSIIMGIEIFVGARLLAYFF